MAESLTPDIVGRMEWPTSYLANQDLRRHCFQEAGLHSDVSIQITYRSCSVACYSFDDSAIKLPSYYLPGAQPLLYIQPTNFLANFKRFLTISSPKFQERVFLCVLRFTRGHQHRSKTMMKSLLRLLWLASLAKAQLESSSVEIVTITGSSTGLPSGEAPAVTVPSNFNGSTIPTASLVSGSTGASNETTTRSDIQSEATYTRLTGGTRSSSVVGGNATATASTAAPPKNTQPCNNYPEFCDRKYSNITEVCAHNSPFVRPRNVASNQELTVTQQLNDGIRMLQGQAHLVNGTLYYCHTSCDLLNAGTVEDYLRTVTEWVAAHTFDVITILFGNANWQDKDANGKPVVTASNFAEPIEASGLLPYVYQPPNTAMTLEDWPTLGELIISGKRVITFIDYNYDTNAVPYLLWEFYNMWETPFSPTIEDFTCEIQRPNGLSEDRSRDMLYMANHNLNVQVSIAGLNLLIPNTADLAKTNGVNGSSSLGEMSTTCIGELRVLQLVGTFSTDASVGKWDRPPNFLLVDYYNFGSPKNGSVFEVAARANNVTYDRECCGKVASLGVGLQRTSPPCLALAIAVAVMMMI